MAIQQGGGSYEYRPYRAPATVKALEARAKAAAEAAAAAQQMQQPISDPWQGAAHLGNILAGGVNQARADQQVAAGREELARLRAGIDMEKGATAEQLAAIGALDPEFADKEYERAMKQRFEIERAEDEQTFRAGESAADRAQRLQEAADRRDFELKQQEDQQSAASELSAQGAAQTGDLQKQADIRRGKMDAFNAISDDPLVKAKLALEQGAFTQEEYDAEVELIGREREAKIAKEQPETITGVPPEVAAARGGDIAKNPQNYSYNTKTQEVTPVEKARSSQDIKTTGEFEKGLIETRSTLGNLDKALELAPNIFEGGGVMGVGDALQRAKTVLLTPSRYDPATVKQAQDTQAYFNIMGEQAIKAMGTTLTGATTEFEMQRFLEIMANPATPLATKQAEISRMREKVRAYEETQRRQVEEAGGNVNAGGNLGSGGGGGGGGDVDKNGVSRSGVPVPQTQAEFDALKPGSPYIDPDDPDRIVRPKP